MNETDEKGFCKKANKVFAAIEFRFVVFFVSLLVLSGPFMALSENRSLHFPFVYYFSVWCFIIAIIAVINACKGEDDTPQGE